MGNGNSDVKVFALSTCIHCRDAKAFLDKCGVTYECVHVDELEGAERKSAMDEVKKINPDCCFPTIQIGEKVIVGFKKNEIREALASR